MMHLQNEYIDLMKIMACPENNQPAQKEAARIFNDFRLRGYAALSPDIENLIFELAQNQFFKNGGILLGGNAFLQYPATFGIINYQDNIELNKNCLKVLAINDDAIKIFNQTINQKDDCIELIVLEHLRIMKNIQYEVYDFLIRNVIKIAVIGKKKIIASAPRPERFAIYKLLLSEFKHENQKENLSMALTLIKFLSENDFDGLQSAWNEAKNCKHFWQKVFQNIIEKLPSEDQKLLKNL